MSNLSQPDTQSPTDAAAYLIYSTLVRVSLGFRCRSYFNTDPVVSLFPDLRDSKHHHPQSKFSEQNAYQVERESQLNKTIV